MAKASKLWLLDEPLTALDETSAQYFYQAMGEHLKQGGMVLMATHTQGDYPVPHAVVNLSPC